MNLGTVALLLVGMYLLSGNNKKQSPDMSDLGSLLNDDARSVMDSVGSDAILPQRRRSERARCCKW